MKFFLWLSFVLHLLAVLGWLYHIQAGKYPRRITKKMNDDVVSVLFALGWAVWVGILLFL